PPSPTLTGPGPPPPRQSRPPPFHCPPPRAGPAPRRLRRPPSDRLGAFCSAFFTKALTGNVFFAPRTIVFTSSSVSWAPCTIGRRSLLMPFRDCVVDLTLFTASCAASTRPGSLLVAARTSPVAPSTVARVFL